MVTDIAPSEDAPEPPDMDVMLDRLLSLAGSRKRLTIEQVRREYPDIEEDPGLLVDLQQLLTEVGVTLDLSEQDSGALQDEAPIVIEHVETEAGSDPVRMYLREIGRVPLLNSRKKRRLPDDELTGIHARMN